MKIAVYAGSFDPMTLGHLSVVKAALAAFDKLFVLIANNPSKQYTFNTEERLSIARDVMSEFQNVICRADDGLVVDFAKRSGAEFLLRGVRGASDVEYETQMANINRTLAPAITTFFVPADPKLAAVSSSGLKEMARCGEDGRRFCTAETWRLLLKNFGNNRPSEQRMEPTNEL